MTSKMTPGPWRLSTFTPERVLNEAGDILATCSVHGRFGDGEVFANATAIAALPALVEAAEAVEAWATSQDASGFDLDAVCLRLIAALKAVRGET